MTHTGSGFRVPFMVNPTLQRTVAKLATAAAAEPRLPPLKNKAHRAADVAPVVVAEPEPEPEEAAAEEEAAEEEAATEDGSGERRGRKHDDEYEAAASAIGFTRARGVGRSVANVLRTLDKATDKFSAAFPEDVPDESGKIAQAATVMAEAYTALNAIFGALAAIPKPKTRAPATAKAQLEVGTSVILKDNAVEMYEGTGAEAGVVGVIVSPAVNRIYKVDFGGKITMVFALHLDVVQQD